MPEVVGVRFKPSGKVYDFEVDGVEVVKGDLVVVESDLGLNIGSVVITNHQVEENERKFKKIIRKATEEDLLQKEGNKTLAKEAMDNCLERIMARGLPMKLIRTEVTLDRKRIIFYFTAEKRIDFRELVKDLAARFKTRIEMRQIGVRDEAKILGSLGICGRELCCARFLTTFEPISIKMAKKQELVLNTGKLSGVCGRLMCCLGFEYSDADIIEDAAVTEEASMSISEEEEPVEMVVASSDLIEEGGGQAAQLGLIESETRQPESHSEQQDQKRRNKKFRRFRRKRKRKPTDQ